MARRKIIEADFAEALRRFSGKVVGLELGEDGDDSISLELGGVSYTVVIVDAYPSGLCQVFGDREYSLPGTIPEVIAQLIEQQKPCVAPRSPEGDAADEGSARELSEGVSSDEDEGGRADSAPACAPDSRLADLRADILAARALFGEESVEVSDLGDSLRMLLHVDPSADGAIDAITAGAWGIDLGCPITVRMVVNASDHALGVAPALQVYQGRTQEESHFEPRKQLATILSGFLRERAERPSKRLRASGGGAAESSTAAAAGVPAAAPAEQESGDALESAEARAHVVALRRRKAQAVEEALVRGGDLATQLLHYASRRLPTLHEHCAICDEPHTQPPMLQRTVCGREFCCWQFAQFGRLISDAEGLNTTAEVTDLLVCMAIHAGTSSRRHLIFDPFPTLFAKDAARPALSPSSEDCWGALRDLMRTVQAARNEAPAAIGASWVGDAERLQRHGELVRPMLQWIVRSARCLLLPLRPEQRAAELGTELQYLLVSAAPEREAAFQALKQKHGSAFAFHGSPAENWHSILRNGLRNASHTPLMLSGASYGQGVYLSPKSHVSAGYSRAKKSSGEAAEDAAPPPSSSHSRAAEPTGNRKLSLESLKMLAVCEVARHQSLVIRGNIWVAPMEETVVTRFLLVYSDAHVPDLSLDEGRLQCKLRACVEASCSGGSCSKSRGGP